MSILFKTFLAILISGSIFMGSEQGFAYSVQMTIDAIEDAGQYPGQAAYLKFVYTSGEHVLTTVLVPNQWTSKQEVIDYADSIPITDWQLQSAGSIWATDLVVGDSLPNLNAGIYRISALSGTFQYDSFNWSQYYGQWRWQLHIQALKPIIGGVELAYYDYMLGQTTPYNSPQDALNANFGSYLDITLAQGGGLIFWVNENLNSIDNSGSLTVNVALIPLPSTLILTGTGLVFLLRRFRRKKI